MPHHPSSSSSLHASGSGSFSLAGGAIDVRTLALRAFRDKVILPISPILEGQLLNIYRLERGRTGPLTIGAAVGEVYQQPRLQQMLLSKRFANYLKRCIVVRPERARSGHYACVLVDADKLQTQGRNFAQAHAQVVGASKESLAS
ncbi:hypothetical protein SCHPADRAFT_948139 [Schizopora paradoxa]|uniref:Uncharacterized protein n=1 Tax=Schizopora paradoxa TaxID=27342 RepID=A0A0H2RGB6_9AGAM|nr:hypothetical protein SCHPADRAFT_948139 [Schizopora paradoxa]